MIRTAAVILLVVIGVPCGAQPPDRAAIPGLVDDLAAAALKAPGSAGLSICVRIDSAVVVNKGYGIADAADGRPVSPDSIFHACSTSKQFVAAAVMRLAERGKLGLDDSIAKHLPEFPTPGDTVTLRHLLTHTSGLKGYTEIPAFEAQEARDLTHEEVLALIRGEPPLFAPGDRFVYCNTGPYLLGMVVERISGKDYGAFLREEFFAPLGLSHTAFDPHPKDESVWAIPHKTQSGKPVHADPISWSNAFAGGGLSSTAGDLAAWTEALAAGRVVSRESYRQMATPHKLNDGTSTAYGFYLYTREQHGHPAVFHTGSGPGCSAWVANYPDDHLIVSVMSNSDAVRAPRLGIGIAMAVFGVDTTVKDLALAEAELGRYCGRFRWEPWEDGGPEVSRFYVKDSHLWVDAGRGRISRLLYQGGGAFAVELEPTYIIAFPQDQGPAPSCTGDGGTHAQTARRIKE